jgi:DNA modification methylase
MKSPFLVHRIEHCPIEQLLTNPKNARVHPDPQIAQLAASIAEFGFVTAVLIGPDNEIICGHGRVLAARTLGLTEVPVIVLDHLTPTQRRALVIADNRLALGSSWNEDMLGRELAALRDEDVDLDLLGFDDQELAQLLAAEESADELTDEDAVPEMPQVPVTRTGDLVMLGNHRLLVGDANEESAHRRVMAGEFADLVFTDLPYNTAYTGYTKDRLTIEGDRMSRVEFEGFLKASFQSYRSVVKHDASLYVCHPWLWQREFQTALEQAGFTARCQLIWAKNTFAWGFGRYKFQHEPIFYCHVAGQKDAWYGNKAQSSLWEENKPAASRLHPTMKPTQLVERALMNSSRRGDILVDLFAGAGSVLIACERKGRKARLMEIDPKYADCIVSRWQKFTGKKAVMDDGRPYDDLARERRLDPCVALLQDAA